MFPCGPSLRAVRASPAKDCLNRMSNTHYCSLTLMSSLKGDWNMVKNSHVG
jgi:hypothetical protein